MVGDPAMRLQPVWNRSAVYQVDRCGKVQIQRPDPLRLLVDEAFFREFWAGGWLH
jgi:hypothetical protein